MATHALLSVSHDFYAGLKIELLGMNLHAVPVRGMPRANTSIGTTRLRVLGSTPLSAMKSSGCRSWTERPAISRPFETIFKCATVVQLGNAIDVHFILLGSSSVFNPGSGSGRRSTLTLGLGRRSTPTQPQDPGSTQGLTRGQVLKVASTTLYNIYIIL